MASKQEEMDENHEHVEYAVNLLKTIADSDEWCDIALVAGMDKQRFLVHRNIMAASSEYFCTLFRSNLNEERNNEIILDDIDGAKLKSIIDYCYTGRITLTNLYEIPAVTPSRNGALERKCCGSRANHVSDLTTIISLADKFGLTNLRQKTLKKICMEFENIPIVELQHLDVHIFREILSCDDVVANETVIFDRLMQWVNGNDETDREKYAPDLLKNIRLEHIPAEFLRSKIDPLSTRYGGVEVVLGEYRERSLDNSVTVLSRIQAAVSICCASWTNDCCEKIQFHKYDVKNDKWIELTSIRKPNDYCHCLVSNGEFVVYIHDKSRSVYRMKFFELKSMREKDERQMRAMQSGIHSIVLGENFYIFGFSEFGRHKDFTLKCERYSTKNHKWKTLSAFRFKGKTKYILYSAIEFSGVVYFRGIPLIEDYRESSSIEDKILTYDTKSDEWSEIMGFEDIYNLFKAKNLLYGMRNVSSVTHSPEIVLIKYHTAREKCEMVRPIEDVEISHAVEYSGKTYVVTVNGEFGIVDPEGECFFRRLSKTPGLPGNLPSLFLV